MLSIENVAIIDDDDVYQYTSKRIIRATHKVEKINSFFNGQEAFDFINDNLDNSGNLPDLIFLDLHMPIFDGWHFLEKYKSIKHRINKKIPIYIITSSMNPDDMILARGFSEVKDYLIKPITEEKFLEILNSFGQT